MNTLIRTVRATAMTMTVMVNLTSIAIALGAFATIYSQSFLTGFLVAAAALISAIIGYGYSLWRVHKIGGRPGLRTIAT
jgi:hypothetical protein